MTRENINRWMEEIKYYGSGGTLYTYIDFQNAWVQIEGSISFTGTEKFSYVMEDEHFEQRKAYALGKTIQTMNFQGDWQDVPIEPRWSSNTVYRVKPKSAVKMNMKDLCDHLGFEVEIVKD